MDKEQTIIDEMNIIVQECIFWQEGHCDYYQCENRYPHCLDYPNCYFKQLARKTQECEELKEKFKKFFGIDNQECWDIAFLKDENARYRKALEEIEEYANENDEMLQGYHHEWANNKQILDIISKAKGEE